MLTTGGKYELYARYANALREYIKKLPEIRKIHSMFINDTNFKDPEYIWMTQDVIYTGTKIQIEPPPEDIIRIIKLLDKKKQIYGRSLCL